LGRQDGEQCWLCGEPSEASLLLLWGLIPLHCLAWRREKLLACMQNQSAALGASVKKSLAWHVVTTLLSGNPAENVEIERFCIKSCLEFYHLLTTSLSGL